MTPLEFLILAFATWRISSMLTQEGGPFGFFLRQRELFGITHDAHHVPTGFYPDDTCIASLAKESPTKFFQAIFTCVWCMSVWVGIALFCLWYFLPILAIIVATPLALSALAILIDART
jgi:hypothetical protein